MNFEYQYKNSLIDLINTGEKTSNRTGINTLTGQQAFKVENVSENFPMLKGKKVFPKLALKELFWMLNGRSDLRWLEDRGVNYWKEWGNEHGTIGKSYGYQFRNFNNIDNLLILLTDLINNSESRRLILNIWNPSDLKEMVLPPCVFNYQFSLIEEIPANYEKVKIYNVDIHVTQRSGDAFLGVPYDIMFSSWFLIVICDLLNHLLAPEKLFISRNVYHTINIYHLYLNHYEQAIQYINNVNENKNNVIDGIVKIKTGIETPLIINPLNYLDIYLKEYLNIVDNEKYKCFKIIKNFEDVYDKIDAQVAI
jgi:thymidylate synthase